MGGSSSKKPKLMGPTLLKEGHKISDFDCGEEVLNLWLQKGALPALAARTANTFVVCRGRHVVGYFSLANSAVAHKDASAKVRRNAPDPIPATLLARLAVNLTEQNQGIGEGLLYEAMKRTLAGSRLSASKMLIVHALNDKAHSFYSKQGFLPLKGGTNALYIPLDTVALAL